MFAQTLLRGLNHISQTLSSIFKRRSSRRDSVGTRHYNAAVQREMNYEYRLAEFGISDTYGFLLPNPMEVLPPPHSIWTDTAAIMPILLEQGQLRAYVDKWPLLSIEALNTDEALYLAHSVLCNIAAAYIWQDGEQNPVNSLPANIAVPLCDVSDLLEVQPVISVLSIILANWKPIDKTKPLDLRNIDVIHQLAGGEKTKWFIIVSIQNELLAVPGIKAIVDSINGEAQKDDTRLISNLNVINNCLKQLSINMLEMLNGLSPDDFYTILRPYFAGYGGPGSFLKEGVLFEGVSDMPKKFHNASAGQSSTIQCFDIALGVEHDSERQAFLSRMRDIMPAHHRRFLEFLEIKCAIKQYVERSQNSALIAAFNRAVTQLTDFRRVHLYIVKRYVIQMKAKYGTTERYGSVATQVFNGCQTTDFLNGFLKGTQASIVPNSKHQPCPTANINRV